MGDPERHHSDPSCYHANHGWRRLPKDKYPSLVDTQCRSQQALAGCSLFVEYQSLFSAERKDGISESTDPEDRAKLQGERIPSKGS
jgi:hypothetical protein